MGEVVIDKCAACMALKQSDCFMISSKSRSDGWLEWVVAAESNNAIHDLVNLLGKNKCEVQLNKDLRFLWFIRTYNEVWHCIHKLIDIDNLSCSLH